jgi:hypothetical protein
MCEGARHIYVAGRERCRCGAEPAAGLNPVETHMAVLIGKEYGPMVEVKFIFGDAGAVGVVAQCARCAHVFRPGLTIARDDWKRMRSSRAMAVKAQQSAARRMIELINASACSCMRPLRPPQADVSN